MNTQQIIANFQSFLDNKVEQKEFDRYVNNIRMKYSYGYALCSLDLNFIVQIYEKGIIPKSEHLNILSKTSSTDLVFYMINHGLSSRKNLDSFVDHFISTKLKYQDLSKLSNDINKVRLLECFIDLRFSENIVLEMIKNGIKPNLACLIKACTRNNVSIVTAVLQAGVKPTPKCYEESHLSEIVVLLVNYGLKLSLADIKTIFDRHRYFPSNEIIEKLGLTLSDEFMGEIYQNAPQIFIKENIKLFTGMIKLRLACANLKLSDIKKIIKEEKVQPDQECLRNACKKKSNTQVVRFLIKKGLKPDLQCLYNNAVNLKSNTTILCLLENMIGLGEVENIEGIDDI